MYDGAARLQLCATQQAIVEPLHDVNRLPVVVPLEEEKHCVLLADIEERTICLKQFELFTVDENLAAIVQIVRFNRTVDGIDQAVVLEMREYKHIVCRKVHNLPVFLRHFMCAIDCK